MADASDEEDDGELSTITVKDTRQKGDSRAEREEKLRKMMEDDAGKLAVLWL